MSDKKKLPGRREPLGMRLQGRRIVCFGMGTSGLACALFLQKHGADPLVVDEAPLERVRENWHKLQAAGIRARPSTRTYEQLENPDLIIVSPGVPTNHPLLQQARAAGAEIIGEIELAYRFCSSPIAAVTGTNGKGTTTSMLELMLQAGGLRTKAGGNIGQALISLVEEPLDILVAEISSFQLETIELFHPWASILLNITPDHMNRYADFAEYEAAKRRLFMNQTAEDIVVLNIDDPITAQLATKLSLPYYGVSLSGKDQAQAYLSGDSLIVHLEEEPVCVATVDDLFLVAPHYITDALCASVVAFCAGVAPPEIAQGLRQWRPAPHQMQEIAVIRGVRFIDDSKATNPESVLADLKIVPRPVFVIAGGQPKGLDMEALADGLVQHCDAVYLIGEAAQELAQALGRRIPVVISQTLAEAVPAAFAAAVPGTTIILAPGCASFDQFRGQAERGDYFIQLVHELQRQCAQEA